MSARRPGWYWQRLRRMSGAEVAHRLHDQARRAAWRRRRVRPGALGPDPSALAVRPPPAGLPPAVAGDVPADVRSAVLSAADELLEGRWRVLGADRVDLVAPDWFLDPLSGRRAPQDRYCFSIDHRSEAETGNVKQVWELSRHHHLTVLAAAFHLSGDVRYAEAVDGQLRDWWRQNPFLSGVHWTSGIELGIRLISWAWVRRLLDSWEGCRALFDDNDDALRQIRWHQQYLDAFRSTGSSANNHVVAEAAGQLVASCAFRWFPESGRWRREAAALLQRELDHNTFPSGMNRELAPEYHGLVAELGLVAAAEADAAGSPLDEATWSLLCRMVDAAAALVDTRLQPPRQNDGDDGRALLVDAPSPNHWTSLLAAGRQVFGPAPWWPPGAASLVDVRSSLLGALAGDHRCVEGRPATRPSHFADAGVTLLRSDTAPEIWCRCDGGPQGFLSIAAHGHADALSVEVRHDGVEVLVDPGTYCYHGEPAWRSYFRSTLGHNTLELAGQDQSVSGGPFLWTRHADGTVLDVDLRPEAGVRSWTAEHDGYERLDPPATHGRTVALDDVGRRIEITDSVSGASRPCRLAFHLGRTIDASLAGPVATLRWPTESGIVSASLSLPAALTWSAHRGEVAPPLGWYSPGFGEKEPTTTLVGTGSTPGDGGEFRTTLQFHH